MCFGNSQQTQSQSYSPPKWLTSAATGNVNFAESLRNAGFSPYTGSYVAPFSGQQQQAFNTADNLAGSVAPATMNLGDYLNAYATAAPGSVFAPSISSQMSPYMNQYIQMSLAPQLQNQDVQFANQNKAFDSSATSAGAFGDTSWALGKGNLTLDQDLSRMGLVGGAYNTGFNTAIGAGAQDVSNIINAQNINQQLRETALGRLFQGANTGYGWGTGTTGLLNQLGGEQTQASQAQLNALYNQYLMKQQYPFQTAGLVNQTIGASVPGAPTTTTTSAPNNMGYGLLGAGVGALGSYAGSEAGAAAITAMFADGGKAQAGKPAVVGERGPEVFVPKADGVVIPNEVMEAAREKRAAKMGGIEQQLGGPIPESHATLRAQQRQLTAGKRHAQFFPKGGEELPVPKNMSRLDTPQGTAHFNPNKITAEQLKQLAARGHLNQAINLGPYSKDETMARAARGEKPLAVTERTPKGTEVRAAAGTSGTAKDQVKHFNKTKTHGNRVGVEAPESVARDRLGGLAQQLGVAA